MNANQPPQGPRPPRPVTLTAEDIDDAIAGDGRAIEAVIHFMAPMVQTAARKLIARRLLPPETVEDLMQDVFDVLLAERAHYLAQWKSAVRSSGTLRSYVYIFARSRMIDSLRRAGRYQPIEDDTLDELLTRIVNDGVGRSSDLSRLEASWILHQHVWPLCTEEEKQLLTWSVEGYSAGDLATQLSISEPAVAQRLSRLRRRLCALVSRFSQ